MSNQATSPVTSPLTAPSTPGPQPPAPATVKTGPRLGVVIWGLLIALVGVWVIAASMGFSVDSRLALIILLALAGLTLVVTALIAALRRPKG
ncbi:MAG: hypothetical protein LBO75_03610 [Bifidobacteriaceae bacterium]|jgi:fatty acid desaturase|nr:hypothetical protein [Bifidobacteriaceae bacterium]